MWNKREKYRYILLMIFAYETKSINQLGKRLCYRSTRTGPHNRTVATQPLKFWGENFKIINIGKNESHYFVIFCNFVRLYSTPMLCCFLFYFITQQTTMFLIFFSSNPIVISEQEYWWYNPLTICASPSLCQQYLNFNCLMTLSWSLVV